MIHNAPIIYQFFVFDEAIMQIWPEMDFAENKNTDIAQKAEIWAWTN